MKAKSVYAILAVVAIVVTTYPLWYSYFSGQSANTGQYLCAPLIPCQPPSSGAETCPTLCIVNIENATFVPGTVRVSAGTTVVWVNHDGFSHTATPFNGSAWSSRIIPPGGSFSFTIGLNLASGAYYYNCNIHPAMIGEVVVLPFS